MKGGFTPSANGWKNTAFGVCPRKNEAFLADLRVKPVDEISFQRC